MVKKGLIVRHKKYGEGIVTKVAADFIDVSFKTYKMQIKPENVDKYLEYDETVVVKAGKISSKKIKEVKTQNYAFKCNYCDGGFSSERVGFMSPCSDDVLKYNVEKSASRWCAFSGCKCKQYYDGNITREELEKEGFVCYESEMFITWGFKAGYDNVVIPPRPRRMPGVLPGGLCVFTTQFPYDKNRYIVGAFIADDVYEGDQNEEGHINCHNQDLRVEFNSEEAKMMNFWDYYSNPNKAESKQWGQGLYRKMPTETSLNILKKIVEIKTGTNQEENAKKMLIVFCEKNRIEMN